MPTLAAALGGVPGATPQDAPAAFLLALVRAHAAGDGPTVAALESLAGAGPGPGDDAAAGGPPPAETFRHAPGEGLHFSLAGDGLARLTGLISAARRRIEAAVRAVVALRAPADPPPALVAPLADVLARLRVSGDLLARGHAAGLLDHARSALESFTPPTDAADLYVPGSLTDADAVAALDDRLAAHGVAGAPYRRRALLDGTAAARECVATAAGRVREVLAARLAGDSPDHLPTAAVQDALDAAGVTSDNPAYAETVVRTNLNGSYAAAMDAKLAEPEMAEAFPVWRYLGVEDGREGDDHRPHFGRYYPAALSFEEVRGPRCFNCRCARLPLGVKIWQKLQAEGARLEGDATANALRD